MKNKFIAMTLAAVMAFSMVACGGSNDTKVIESGNAAGAGKAAQGQAGYVFTYDSVDMGVDYDAAPVVEALGEPKSYFESPSCAADGIGKLYTYNDFEIQTYPDGDKDLILSVLLKTDSVATKEGIDLSNTKEEVIAAYGEPTEEESGAIRYEKNGTTLQFLFEGESMISIEYYNSTK